MVFVVPMIVPSVGRDHICSQPRRKKKMSDNETKDVVVISTDKSPAALMMTAIEKGLDLDKVEKAMALQERYEANEARKAYHDAMAGFKSNPPEIDKDRHVKFQTAKGTTEYRHASLANVTDKINSALSQHGLSAGWKVSQADKQITVTCTITHRLGHSESTALSASPDDSGSKNQIQAVGSTISYLSRYTLLALTGLATHDMDDDGNGSGEPTYITTDQATELNDLIKETSSDLKKFLEYLATESVEKIPAESYNKALIALKNKQKVMRQPGE
jgi:hypothetical protein